MISSGIILTEGSNLVYYCCLKPLRLYLFYANQEYSLRVLSHIIISQSAPFGIIEYKQRGFIRFCHIANHSLSTYTSCTQLLFFYD